MDGKYNYVLFLTSCIKKMKLHQHVGSAPLHRRVARQVRVTSPVMLYPVLQAYVTVSWYRLPVTTELPFLGLPGSPQFTPDESSITKSKVISCCWTNYSLPLRFRQISVKNFTVSVSFHCFMKGFYDLDHATFGIESGRGEGHRNSSILLHLLDKIDWSALRIQI